MDKFRVSTKVCQFLFHQFLDQIIKIPELMKKLTSISVFILHSQRKLYDNIFLCFKNQFAKIINSSKNKS